MSFGNAIIWFESQPEDEYCLLLLYIIIKYNLSFLQHCKWLHFENVTEVWDRDVRVVCCPTEEVEFTTGLFKKYFKGSNNGVRRTDTMVTFFCC